MQPTCWTAGKVESIDLQLLSAFGYFGRPYASSEVNLQFVDLVHISVSHPSNFLFYSDSAHYHCTTRLSRTPLQISLSPRATRAVQICH